jgi:hypothetical protein
MKRRSLLVLGMIAAMGLSSCGSVSSSISSVISSIPSSEASSSSSSSSSTPEAPNITLRVSGPLKVYTESPAAFVVSASDNGTYAYTWTSSDTTIAAVNARGIVTGKAAGHAVISVALTAFPGVAAQTGVDIVTVLPTLGEMFTEMNTVKNYTVSVTKADADSERFLYTSSKVRLTTAGGTDKRFALGKDGIAFSYQVQPDGTIQPGEKIKDLGGYVTADTLLGNTADPYYCPILGPGYIDTSVLPAPDVEGGDSYTLFDAPDGYDGDRYTWNKRVIAVLCDIDIFDFVYKAPSLSGFGATVVDAGTVEFTVSAKVRGGSVADYVLTIANIGSTVIPDDGIDAYTAKANGGTAYVPDQVYGIANEAKISTSYLIADDYMNSVFTPTYMYAYYLDTTFTPDSYDPTTYSYYGYGYVKRSDGIYAFKQDTTFDIAANAVTRATPVLGDKVEGTTADSTMADTLGYISTWKIFDDVSLLTDTTRYMSANNGWATNNSTIAEDALAKVSKWGYLLFTAYVDDGHTASGYRTHISGLDTYYPMTYLSYSTFILTVGYQDKESLQGKSSGYNFNNYQIKGINAAKNTAIETWIATLA